MEITTESLRSTRSGRTTRHDVAAIWPPLADLADAASRIAVSEAVVISRGFDRNSRQRAKALRDLLNDRGVPAIEVTPAPGSERLLAGAEIGAVVNLVGKGSWQPHRLAAKLRTPVLAPSTDQSGEITRGVIAMTNESGKRDIALSHVAVRPEDSSVGTLTITSGGESTSVRGGWLSISLVGERLEIRLGGPGMAEKTLTAREILISTVDTPHRLVRDELPIADFEGAVTFTAEPRGLVVRPV